MELTEHELEHTQTGYPIYLPKSHHPVDKVNFSDKFWQQRVPQERYRDVKDDAALQFLNFLERVLVIL